VAVARRRPGGLSARMDVVIVEDEDDTRDLFAVLAHAAGWVVATFATAQLAQRWDGWPDADVLVADFNLPGMTGSDLCAWVRAEHPHVYTILTSAVDPAADRREIAHVYIDKGEIAVQLTELLEALRAR
jgi:CheY-like chemotaxis protein